MRYIGKLCKVKLLWQNYIIIDLGLSNDFKSHLVQSLYIEANYDGFGHYIRGNKKYSKFLSQQMAWSKQCFSKITFLEWVLLTLKQGRQETVSLDPLPLTAESCPAFKINRVPFLDYAFLETSSYLSFPWTPKALCAWII